MRCLSRRAVFAAAALVVPLLAFTAPASAAPAISSSYWCLTLGSGECMDQAGSGSFEVTSYAADYGTFGTTDSATWKDDGANRTTYEWQLTGTNDCVTWSSSAGTFYLTKCDTFPASQSFWYDDAKIFINEYATVDYGTDTCVYANTPHSGSSIVASSCASSRESNNEWTVIGA